MSSFTIPRGAAVMVIGELLVISARDKPDGEDDDYRQCEPSERVEKPNHEYSLASQPLRSCANSGLCAIWR